MNPDLQRDLMAALERPHRLGTIGGDLEEQLAHCASFSSVLEQIAPPEGFGRGIDLGTGGGLPGIALAALWPDTSWTLVDMRAARADEVERTVLRLGYGDRVHVLAMEAQHVGHEEMHREAYDIVVARAFGPSSVTAECAAGVAKPGGRVVISEPPDDEPGRWNETGLGALGLGLPQFHDINGSRFCRVDQDNTAGHGYPATPLPVQREAGYGPRFHADPVNYGLDRELHA